MARDEYDDYDDEEMEEEEFEEYVPGVSETPWWMQKAVPVLISSAVHLMFLWIAAYIVFTIVQKKEPPAIVTQREFAEPEYDETLTRARF